MVMFAGIFSEIMIGMGFKFALTAGGAEIKLMVTVSNAAVRLVRQDDHPAHGISHLIQCGDSRPGMMSAQNSLVVMFHCICHFSS